MAQTEPVVVMICVQCEAAKADEEHRGDGDHREVGDGEAPDVRGLARGIPEEAVPHQEKANRGK
jgi:hypothetical protein